MKEKDLYKYIVEKAVSFGMEPKNIPSVKGVEFVDINPIENGNAVIRHSLSNGAYIGLIDSGQPVIEDDFENSGLRFYKRKVANPKTIFKTLLILFNFHFIY